METKECLKKRRSIRKYKIEALNDEQLKTIVSSGTLAPSGMHVNELVFVGLSKDTSKKMQDLILSLIGRNPYYGAPNIVLVFKDNRKNGLFDLDAGAAMENMLLTATDLGFGSCWIHYARDFFKTKEGKEFQMNELGLDPNVFEGLESIAIGYNGEVKDCNDYDEGRCFIK